MIFSGRFKKMGHSLSYLFIYLFMLLGFTPKINAQSECEVHRDTLYLIALWEQQFHSYPYNVTVQPNEGYVWSKIIEKKTIDTSRYELMVKSFYSESVFCFDLYWDLQESRVANCKNNYPREDYLSMMLRFEDQMDSLNNPHYYRTKSFTIYNDTIYTRESHDFDTVVATVNVSVSFCKLIVDYYIIPITPESPIPTSTVDLQYKELPYSFPYRYQLKQIVKILPLEERERIIFYGN